jgi:predicted NUDIX family NTP pyrophosphohydrolase
MKNISAGLLMYRKNSGNTEFFLVHPGGPYFARKETGVWTIPKGLPEDKEDLLDAAQREFFEETGIRPTGPFIDVGSIRQKGGKTVFAWAFSGSWAPDSGITCNTFTLEWPPRSGRKVEFPEVDKANWFTLSNASQLIIPEQLPFLERATDYLTG